MVRRIPRKKGQRAKSKKHSDLYTDEDPKGTIHGLKFWNGTPLPSTYGIGLISQKVEGNTLIKGIDKTIIAESSYDSGLQRFYLIGWSLNFEFLQMSFILRYVTSPILKIKNCNIEAVGELACSRIKSATGNRNNSPQIFTGGV